jgi:hypothetical protein
MIRNQALSKSSLLVITLGLTSLLLGGCTRFAILPMREKEKSTVIGGKAGIRVDRAIYGTATGPVDLLFVSDNSDRVGGPGQDIRLQDTTNTPALAWFQNHYQLIQQKLEATQLDYRMHIAMATNGKAPTEFLKRKGEKNADHFTQLGLSAPGYFFGAEEFAPLNPLKSTESALSVAPFSGRSLVPLFLVYFLGQDVDPADPALATPAKASLKKGGREDYQTHVITLTKGDGASIGTCRLVHPAQFLNAVRGAAAQSFQLETHDLCDLPAGPADFSTYLVNKISDFMGGAGGKFVLSKRPYRPELMVVRASGQVFRFGVDYTYEESSNSITFAPAVGLTVGQSLEFEYYLEPEGGAGGSTSLDSLPGSEKTQTKEKPWV